MGDAAAEYSIGQVLDAHGDELFREATANVQAFLAALGVEVASERFDVVFAIEATQLDVRLTALDAEGQTVMADGRRVSVTVLRFDIAELAERFPDCNVGW